MAEIEASEAADPLKRSARDTHAGRRGERRADCANATRPRARACARAAARRRAPAAADESAPQIMAPLAPYTPDAVQREASAHRLRATRASRPSAARRACRSAHRRATSRCTSTARCTTSWRSTPRCSSSARTSRRRAASTRSPPASRNAFKGSARLQHAARRDDDPRPRAGRGLHGAAALPRDPVPRLLPQRLRPDARRGLLAPVLLQRPVPQPDGHPHRVARLPEGLRRPLPQRQLLHRAARHSRARHRVPVARRRRGDDAAHLRRARARRRARRRVPRADRAVHDEGPARGEGRPVAVRLSAAGAGGAARRAARLPPDARRPAHRDLRQRRRTCRCAPRARSSAQCGAQVRVLDLRWLKPLNVDAIAQHAADVRHACSSWTKDGARAASRRRSSRRSTSACRRRTEGAGRGRGLLHPARRRRQSRARVGGADRRGGPGAWPGADRNSIQI